MTSLWKNRVAQMSKHRSVPPETIIEEFSHEIPMERFGKPEEIAPMVAFLASYK